FAPSSASASAAARPRPDEAPQTIAVLPRRPRSMRGDGSLRRVFEVDRERAVPAELPAERVVVDVEPVGRVLRARPVVAGDAAGNALGGLERCGRLDADRLADAETRAVELDRAYLDLDHVPRLADPRQPHHVAA